MDLKSQVKAAVRKVCLGHGLLGKLNEIPVSLHLHIYIAPAIFLEDDPVAHLFFRIIIRFGCG